MSSDEDLHSFFFNYNFRIRLYTQFFTILFLGEIIDLYHKTFSIHLYTAKEGNYICLCVKKILFESCDVKEICQLKANLL